MNRKYRHNVVGKLLKEHGTKCYLCGLPMREGIDQLNVDHVIPLFHGGKDDWHNLKPVHATCNHHRNHMHLDLWYRSDRLPRAIKNIFRQREHPHKNTCLDCGVDISHRDKQAILCKRCYWDRKNAINYAKRIRTRKTECQECGADIMNRPHQAKYCKPCAQKRAEKRIQGYRAQAKERYQNDPEYRAHINHLINTNQTERRKNDPEWREQRNRAERIRHHKNKQPAQLKLNL